MATSGRPRPTRSTWVKPQFMQYIADSYQHCASNVLKIKGIIGQEDLPTYDINERPAADMGCVSVSDGFVYSCITRLLKTYFAIGS
ncbi:hypothetical protein [uncultured Sphaerochaeta sp.]|uniref:hypothetical protein n=1 Tax=uncultured Sphaerochaeta sp. TaxID=886478 RepID=UPI002A0A342A|nr:hypothetical protein [uncultured Sphaerochaeta sp.]